MCNFAPEMENPTLTLPSREGKRKFGETAPKSRQRGAGFAQICAKNEK